MPSTTVAENRPAQSKEHHGVLFPGLVMLVGLVPFLVTYGVSAAWTG